MKRKKKSATLTVHIDAVIHTVRGERVILDSDLARVYGVSTKALNQTVKRNLDRFPSDFLIPLTKEEWATLRSQFVTSKETRGGRRYLPFAFTEHGAVMAANFLKTRRAIQMSVFVVRAFIKLREAMTTNKAIVEKLHALEEKLTRRLDAHEQAIVYVLMSCENSWSLRCCTSRSADPLALAARRSRMIFAFKLICLTRMSLFN